MRRAAHQENMHTILQPPVGIHEKFVHAYLVGDAAFGLSPTLIKCYEGTPAEHSAEGKFNRAVINSRRAVECAFGRLKTRWAFCNRNTFWGEPTFTRDAIHVCTGLHNFIQRRTGELLEYAQNAQGEEQPHIDLDIGDGQVNMGGEVRDFLAKWLSPNADE